MREDRGSSRYWIIRRCQSDFAAVVAVTWLITLPILWVKISSWNPSTSAGAIHLDQKNKVQKSTDLWSEYSEGFLSQFDWVVFTVTSSEFETNILTIISRLKMQCLWITQPRFLCKMENTLFFRLFSLYYHPNLTILYFHRNVDLYWCARIQEGNCSLSSCSLRLWLLFSLWIVNLTNTVGFFEVPSLSEWRVMHENMTCFWHGNSCLILPCTTSCFSKGWKCSPTSANVTELCDLLYILQHLPCKEPKWLFNNTTFLLYRNSD